MLVLLCKMLNNVDIKGLCKPAKQGLDVTSFFSVPIQFRNSTKFSTKRPYKIRVLSTQNMLRIVCLKDVFPNARFGNNGKGEHLTTNSKQSRSIGIFQQYFKIQRRECFIGDQLKRMYRRQIQKKTSTPAARLLKYHQLVGCADNNSKDGMIRKCTRENQETI